MRGRNFPVISAKEIFNLCCEVTKNREELDTLIGLLLVPHMFLNAFSSSLFCLCIKHFRASAHLREKRDANIACAFGLDAFGIY